MKALSAGSEIDAWCTKCKMDLGHRIVAMVGPAPKRVICLTCGSQHNYRAPRSEPKAKGAARPAGARAALAGTGRVSQRNKSELERQAEWEARIAGAAVTAFARYSMDRRFSPGQLVTHSKFGEGYVVEVVDGAKVNIMFRDGQRTLAQKSAD